MYFIVFCFITKFILLFFHLKSNKNIINSFKQKKIYMDTFNQNCIQIDILPWAFYRFTYIRWQCFPKVSRIKHKSRNIARESMARKIKLTYFINQRHFTLLILRAWARLKLRTFRNEYEIHPLRVCTNTEGKYFKQFIMTRDISRRRDIYPLVAPISLSVKVKTCSGYR